MAGEYIEVKNFDKFQHYKDRNPIWIKLYYELLDDYEFSRLDDAAKWLAVGLWMLASRCGNRIPNDSEWIAKRLSLKAKPNLNALLGSGFISIVAMEQSASNALASRYQDACLEKETEKETEKKKDLGAASLLFEVVWTDYPRKVNKTAAKKAWDKATRSNDPKAVEAGVYRYIAFVKANATEQTFIKHLATLLNSGDWQDEWAIEGVLSIGSKKTEEWWEREQVV